MINTTDNAKNQARAQLDHIIAMMSAIYCDYDRLEELDNSDFDELNQEEKEELAELKEQADSCADQDEARERAQENALSLEVRSDWQSLGEPLEASEYCILLCTGGPAVRIIGEFDNYKEPRRAVLQYQDWGTSWTDFFDFKDDESQTLLDYARLFYWG